MRQPEFKSIIDIFPYGAPELKEAERHYLFKALRRSVIGHLIIISSYYVVKFFFPEEPPPPDERIVRVVKYADIEPPPSISNSPPKTIPGLPVIAAGSKSSQGKVSSIELDPDNKTDQSSLFRGVDIDSLDSLSSNQNEDIGETILVIDTVTPEEDFHNPISKGGKNDQKVFSGNDPSEEKEGKGKVEKHGKKGKEQIIHDEPRWIRLDLSGTNKKWMDKEVGGREFTDILSFFYNKIEHLRNVQESKVFYNNSTKMESKPFTLTVFDFEGLDYRLHIPTGSDKIHFSVRPSTQEEIKVDPLLEARKLKALLQNSKLE